MTDLESYAKDPRHGLVGDLGRAMGVPEDGSETVTCADCGRQFMAYSAAWRVGKNRWSGPHCGCTKPSQRFVIAGSALPGEEEPALPTRCNVAVETALVTPTRPLFDFFRLIRPIIAEGMREQWRKPRSKRRRIRRKWSREPANWRPIAFLVDLVTEAPAAMVREMSAKAACVPQELAAKILFADDVSRT